MSKTIRVAAVQMNCDPGKIDRNLEHAEKLIANAVEKGAKLVLLPAGACSSSTLGTWRADIEQT